MSTTSVATAYDEAWAGPGAPRPHYASVLAELERTDLEALAAGVDRAVRARDCYFGPEEAFRLDPVPRILPRAEWDDLAAGLEQRVRALEHLVADLYGARRIVAEGVVPARVVETCDHFEPLMAGVDVTRWIGVAGLDVIRDAEGEFRVLEDNLRTPSGVAYSATAAEVVRERLQADGVLPVDADLDGLVRALSSAAHVDAPEAVLLSDGPSNSAWWEHEWIAARLGIPVVRLADLERRANRLWARVDGRRRPVDVLYRRTDEDRMTDGAGRLTPIGEALLPALRAGTLGMVNAFGAGVADDKLVHAYVEDAVRFYLSEEPLLHSVRTFDLDDPEQAERALERLPELVIKPRSGSGGEGVVIGPRASSAELDACASALRADPGRFIAQETVLLSSHPTVVDGALEPRHVDLRPFVLGGRAVPGGLTRFARPRGSLVVNSSQQGGSKDTWVMAS